MFKSYTVSKAYASTATFSFSGGSGTSTGNAFGVGADQIANGDWTLAPGQTGRFTASGLDASKTNNIRSWTWDVYL